MLGSYFTCILHTARISNIDVVLCGERRKEGTFKPGETNVKKNFERKIYHL